jgi:hypothetical protein
VPAFSRPSHRAVTRAITRAVAPVRDLAAATVSKVLGRISLNVDACSRFLHGVTFVSGIGLVEVSTWTATQDVVTYAILGRETQVAPTATEEFVRPLRGEEIIASSATVGRVGAFVEREKIPKGTSAKGISTPTSDDLIPAVAAPHAIVAPAC